MTTGRDGEALVAPSKDVMDNATPAANTMAAVALLRLGALTGEARYQRAAEDVLELLGELAGSVPSAFANLLAAAEMDAVGITEVAVVGDAPQLVAAVQAAYRPNVVLAWGEPYPSPLWEGREGDRAYVCRDYACQAPVTETGALEAQLAGPPPA
jgi:uncharacterized protein YyaL (SSP411 family)